jgi:hypothetical protein
LGLPAFNAEPLAEFHVIAIQKCHFKIARGRRRVLTDGELMTGATKNPGRAGESTLTDDTQEGDGAELSPLVVEAVGKALNAHFQAIADMPLPDRLLVLLAELEAREHGHDH